MEIRVKRRSGVWELGCTFWLGGRWMSYWEWHWQKKGGSMGGPRGNLGEKHSQRGNSTFRTEMRFALHFQGSARRPGRWRWVRIAEWQDSAPWELSKHEPKCEKPSLEPVTSTTCVILGRECICGASQLPHPCILQDASCNFRNIS